MSVSGVEVSPTLQRFIHDVRSFQLPALMNGNPSTQQMESMEKSLLATLKRIDVELENFAMECTDAGSDASERADWSKALERAQLQTESIRQEAQSALFKARRQWKAQARDALWSDMAESREERERRRETSLADRSSEDKLMIASGDVTSALQRAVTLMSIELEKSSYSSQLLDESSLSIQQATLEYTSFTNLVSSSRKIIKSMERADFLDAIMLSLSFLFFVLCIAYIVKVRVWDRGIGLISFFIRLGGLGTSKSAGDVKEKLKLAKLAAKQVESSKAAETAKSVVVSTVTSITSSLSSSSGQNIQTPSIIDLESDPTFSSTSVIPSITTPLQEHFVHDEL